VAVTVHFAAQAPILREIIAVRRLLPEYRDLPPSQVRAMLGASGGLGIKPLPGAEAAQGAAHGRELGLRLETADASCTSGFPFHPAGSQACIIEDDALADEACRRMMRAGVPVLDPAEGAAGQSLGRFFCRVPAQATDGHERD